MSTLMEYWGLAISGFERFVADYKYTALIICVLLYAVVHRKRYKRRELKKFLLYSGGMMILLMVPMTGIMFLIYQTRFYDYEWIWSCVPLTALLAWGIVTVVFEEISPEMVGAGKTLGGKNLTFARWCGIAAAVAALFICGNQGRVQQVSEETIQIRRSGENILEYLESEDLLQEHVVWGPAQIMEYMRSHNGSVVLFYGRDMWDAKAGAYDYEVYGTEEIICYEWMECVSSAHNLYLLEVEQAPDALHEALATEEYIRLAISRDVDVVILPSQITGWVERKMQLIADENKLSTVSAQVGEYTVWVLE